MEAGYLLGEARTSSYERELEKEIQPASYQRPVGLKAVRGKNKESFSKMKVNPNQLKLDIAKLINLLDKEIECFAEIVELQWKIGKLETKYKFLSEKTQRFVSQVN